MDNWSKEIPNKPGQYWFVGYAWAKNEEKKELYYVSVCQASNSLVFITCGNFMENKEGLWQKVFLPETPEGTKIR